MVTPEDALQIIVKQYPYTTTKTVFDYGEYYVIYPIAGDMSDEAFKIDKANGYVSDYSFLEYMEYMANLSEDEDVKKYIIKT